MDKGYPEWLGIQQFSRILTDHLLKEEVKT